MSFVLIIRSLAGSWSSIVKLVSRKNIFTLLSTYLCISCTFHFRNISDTVNSFNLVLRDQIASGQHPERQFTPGNRMRLLSLPCFICKLTYTISAFKDQVCCFEPKFDYKIKNETSIRLEKQYAMSGGPHWLLYRNTTINWFTDFCETGFYGENIFPLLSSGCSASPVCGLWS